MPQKSYLEISVDPTRAQLTGRLVEALQAAFPDVEIRTVTASDGKYQTLGCSIALHESSQDSMGHAVSTPVVLTTAKGIIRRMVGADSP